MLYNIVYDKKKILNPEKKEIKMNKSSMLGELMIANDIIKRENLEEALSVQNREGGLLGMILIKLHHITEEQLTEILRIQKRER